MRKYPIFILVLISFIFACSCNNDDAQNNIYYTVTINTDEGGTVNLTSGEYLSGTTLEVTASPLEGYSFDGWDGDIVDTNPTISFEVSGAISINANFSETVTISENVVVLNEDLIDDSGYIFAIENGQNTCYLLDHFGNKVFTWEFDDVLGQDIEITTDGTVLGLFKASNPEITFGGQAGLIREIDKDGTILWEYELSTTNEITHHDLTKLPNGNVLALVWERIPNADAVAVGLNKSTDIFTEKLIEIDPSTDTIVWEWRSWEHIVQDFDENLDSFGDPSVEKNKINIRHANSIEHQFAEIGDIMHSNGLDYLPEQDIIVLSINFYSEVWFIDHSTTTAEAKTETGGQFNRGGDLLYRFGNQKVFGDLNASSIFDYNHHPTFVNTNGELSLLIFNNNEIAGQSSAMEFRLPTINGSTTIGGDPELLFEFTDANLFNPRISGADRLPNGNTLICEGDYGFWEVTPAGEVVWKYDGNGIPFWRGIFYSKDSDEILSLGI
ncbi:aryl-sulfate sulfotransferase [Flagellimonas zhangzhouensis]|uniref:Arylsulfotransferase (ASST) n=1 Tax=Flagellimonas zhangzhouensis TaxID=1073328 RepID=A0A1H2VU53_9FLAO|nr:aryl-sulfate sulfotransferase [Allomuricauda zhangzhouensis]SDQ05586.1 Arylsulfotransferase (ASST) [Allomuricauda zhangzhouensis]SDW71893.1 Arylsulfotransferase (ASST) [Allomuricauda zhangzhouensis]